MQKSSPSLRIVMWGSSSASGRRRMTIKSSSGYFFVLHQRFFHSICWLDGWCHYSWSFTSSIPHKTRHKEQVHSGDQEAKAYMEVIWTMSYRDTIVKRMPSCHLSQKLNYLLRDGGIITAFSVCSGNIDPPRTSRPFFPCRSSSTLPKV